MAAFIPLDLNSATARDLVDILGLDKDQTQKLVSKRPFVKMDDLVRLAMLTKSQLETVIGRGAVLKVSTGTAKRPDLNRAVLEEIVKKGVSEAIAARLVRGRPFSTWSELEEYLGCDANNWLALRQGFCLSISD